MTDIIEVDTLKQLALDEHDSITTGTKKSLLYGWDSVGLQKVRLGVDENGKVYMVNSSQLVPFIYDYISLGYTGNDLTSVVYKTGGATGTTVATLTLAYTDSVLQTITRT